MLIYRGPMFDLTEMRISVRIETESGLFPLFSHKFVAAVFPLDTQPTKPSYRANWTIAF